ncbi:DUF6575 domain-containing protein [Kluyvera intermedia]|uniref:DUF6575 domain-containing protein n=1 Tax=Kluyvera intermedia TaxID=61648 RepID=A0ABX6DPR6_KLUIN|nr:DUF6575 domain-containing protein [Kluyvera intermedia]QGH30464.1 hypothetical protein GHC21_12625 [Kluyvera intermedia]QGH39446.1 hypothetical protein GHC38_12625 [Kluyvera intermedia]
MKKIFAHSPIHGELYFKTIYDYFDGPKLFSLVTKRGDTLLAYWSDESDYSYSWVLISLSKPKLLAFESKSIDIYTILNEKDEKYFFLMETPFKKGSLATATCKLGDIKDHILMPDKGLKISFLERIITDEEILAIKEENILSADYSIHIDKPKNSKALIDFSMISPVFQVFDELYTQFIASMKLNDKLIPVCGRPGSFILDFNSTKFNLIENELHSLSELIKNRRDINSFITEKKIPSQSLEALFNHIIEDDLVIDLSNKNSKDDFFKINKSDAEFYLRKINQLTSLDVNSKQAPQADTLEKIFSVVENIWENGFLIKHDVKLSDRHALYYTDAAKILGFISASGSVTSIGQQLILSPNDKRLSIAAQSFENSHCGWTWVTWSKVDNITKIDPSTAKKFLDECAPTLSESTKLRRARTLRSWCIKLAPSYREWK